MKLDDSRRSDNVEDDRGSGGGLRGIHLGLGGTLVILVIGYFMGISPSTLLSLLNGDNPASSTSTQAPAPSATAPGATAPGTTSPGTSNDPQVAGPFYCPGDRKVYIDLAFFHQLASQFGAPGDFARAYVIAHEVGHHVQELMGTTDKAAHAEQQSGRTGANKVSVMVELQADCLAGVWAQQANQARHILETGDLEQGLQAASSVGDDTLQKKTQGTVVPDSFTHGTSSQRVRWFRRGFDSGKIDNCDTFGAGASL